MSDSAQMVTVDGRRVYDSDDGDQLDGLALAEWFGEATGKTSLPVITRAEYLQAVERLGHVEFLRRQLESRGTL
jgi:hypothetical protein